MKNRICIIVTVADSFNYMYKGHLEYLKKCGFDITMICGGEESELNKLRERNVGKIINIKMKRKPSPACDAISLCKLFFHLVFNRYDLIIVTTPKAILLGSLASKLAMQRRRISFFQGRAYENYIGIKRRFFSFLDFISILCTNKSLFVSHSLMFEYTKDIPLIKKKGKVIANGSGNGVAVDYFSKDILDKRKIKELKQNLGIKENDFVFISIGRICKDKGFYEIAEIAERLSEKYNNIKFIMLGKVEDNKFYEVYKNLFDNGVVMHAAPVDDIRPYLALADIHLFLTHREGFGNVAIEAASMNIPTFAFDVVGVRDSVKERVSGLKFPLGDINSVIEAIEKYMENPTSYRSEFNGARAWVSEAFSQDEVWENYVKFYFEELK